MWAWFPLSRMVHPTHTVWTQVLVVGIAVVIGGVAVALLNAPLSLAIGALLVLATAGLFVKHRAKDSTDTTPRAVTDGGTNGIELVVAIIRPGKLNDVKRGLVEAGAPSLTVTNVSGRGSQPSETSQWRGEQYIVDLHQKVKVECAVPADQTDDVVDAIQSAASTGEPGDGKIFVVPVLDACRVSTDERGIAAM